MLRYNNLARTSSRIINAANSYTTQYTYLDGAGTNTTTALVESVKNGATTLSYTYDNVGNITEVKKDGTIIEAYTYNSTNQLTSATYGGHTYYYLYNSGGNIIMKEDSNGTKQFRYGEGNWNDVLINFNGQRIISDSIGNPLSYRDDFVFTWSNGRQLTGIQKGNNSISYLYNADGLRAQKTVNGTTTNYYYLNGVLQGQKTGNEYIIFLYDENGSAYGLILKNGTTSAYYYYVFNLQGDVIGLIDSSGNQVVSYTYDPWGKVLSVTGTLGTTIGEKNPIRYRGYYYDSETEFYYLQSRYYDPETGRFINADNAISGVGNCSSCCYRCCCSCNSCIYSGCGNNKDIMAILERC